MILIKLETVPFTELMFNKGSGRERKSSVSMILETILCHNFFSPDLDRVISKYYFRLENQKLDLTPHNRNVQEAIHSKSDIKNHAGGISVSCGQI